MQARAIPGPWAAGERVLVCVSEDPRAAGLVRYAKRLSDRLHAPFVALSIETRRTVGLPEEERDRIADTLRLAHALGGDAATIPGGDRRIADDILAYAHANNITQIVIGKSARSRWFEILNGSVVHDLVRGSGNISVHVIAGDREPGQPIPKKTVRTAPRQEPLRLFPTRWHSWPSRSVSEGSRDRAVARHRECGPGVAYRHRGDRGSLRPLSIAVRERDRFAVL